MLKNVAFRMKLFWLGATLHPVDLWENGTHQSARIEQIPATHSVWGKKNADKLFADSFCADLIDRDRLRDQRFPRLIVDLVIKHGGEAHRAQHSQPIFCETLRRVANCAHQFRLNVGATADEIDHFLRNRIVKHSVDREIAAFCVLFR